MARLKLQRIPFGLVAAILPLFFTASTSFPSPESHPTGNGTAPVDPAVVVHNFSPPDQKWEAGHRGVDLEATAGTPVRAIVDGQVRFAGHVAGKPVVSIDIGSGLTTTFEPLDADVSRGEKVDKGQVIGAVATDGGHCAGSCLHVGLREITGEQYFNPLRLWDTTPVTIVLLPVQN